MINPFLGEEPFTRAHAYDDLVRMVGDGVPIPGIATLQARWQWSRQKVRSFLKHPAITTNLQPNCGQNGATERTIPSVVNSACCDNLQPVEQPISNHFTTILQPAQKERENEKKESTKERKDKEKEKDHRQTSLTLAANVHLSPAAPKYLKRKKQELHPYPTDESPVWLTETDLKLLQMRFSEAQLTYLIDNLSQQADDNPKSFRKYVDHYMTLIRRDKYKREKGLVWLEGHGDPAGYYPHYVAEKVRLA